MLSLYARSQLKSNSLLYEIKFIKVRLDVLDDCCKKAICHHLCGLCNNPNKNCLAAISLYFSCKILNKSVRLFDSGRISGRVVHIAFLNVQTFHFVSVSWETRTRQVLSHRGPAVSWLTSCLLIQELPSWGRVKKLPDASQEKGLTNNEAGEYSKLHLLQRKIA
jgi:hypothetical protein